MGVVEFPGLGLKFAISRVAFQVFGLPIYWYGIILALSFLLAVVLAVRKSKEFGIDPENIIDLVLFAAPIAVITARIYYVVFDSNFKGNFLDVFNTRNGGLAIYGAVIGAVGTAYFFTKVKKISFTKLVDFCAPYLILAQAIGRWGNFVNQEAFGVNTTLPWGMTGTGIKQAIADSSSRLSELGITVNPAIPVHPTFLYESLWSIACFAVLIWFRKRKKLNGEVFSLYLILYGIGRAWIEPLRIDSLMLGSFRISQVIAITTVVVFIVLFIWRRTAAHGKTVHDFNDVEIGMSEYGQVLKKVQGVDLGAAPVTFQPQDDPHESDPSAPE